MKSKDYQILVDKIKDEIQRNKNLIKIVQQKSELAEIAYEHIKYHKAMIKFIEKIDNEI